MSLRRCISCLLFIFLLASCGTAASMSTSLVTAPTSVAPHASPVPCECGAKADRVGLVPPTAAPADASSAIVAQGLLVYKKYGCGTCHALSAANAVGVTAPSSDGIGVRAAERIASPGYTGHATSAEAYIRESITDPDIYYVTGFELSQTRMPRPVAMTETELEALVQMLLRQ